MAHVPSYDPTTADQPATDEDMGEWDDLDDQRAHDARALLLDLTRELEALIREMGAGK
ncbi:hypothetical protein [Kitasatospora sp. NBC_01302]|uniref:hypothetical protein n=1 Tax=Kitasatospora sp. NBC_01302 TaxID=2903575 RepID=UPI002E129318|nr:hypothetical protein OG294_09230 [Kitasatospora sp. NBC_01302]